MLSLQVISDEESSREAFSIGDVLVLSLRGTRGASCVLDVVHVRRALAIDMFDFDAEEDVVW